MTAAVTQIDTIEAICRTMSACIPTTSSRIAGTTHPGFASGGSRALDDVHLVIAGDGPEKQRLEKLTREAALGDRVTFTGWVDDIRDAMSDWDIYAQPSIAEGIGIAALEAMAQGIPVVASEIGGLREIVVNGETGFLVPSKDSAQLAAHLKELVCNPDLRARMGEAARRRATENFSRERESNAIQTAYQKLLA
jgi:glycosyltransferase involved in cell wall biosynthesis